MCPGQRNLGPAEPRNSLPFAGYSSIMKCCAAKHTSGLHTAPKPRARFKPDILPGVRIAYPCLPGIPAGPLAPLWWLPAAAARSRPREAAHSSAPPTTTGSLATLVTRALPATAGTFSRRSSLRLGGHTAGEEPLAPRAWRPAGTWKPQVRVCSPTRIGYSSETRVILAGGVAQRR